MPFNIRVCSLAEVPAAVRLQPNAVVVSLLDPYCTFPRLPVQTHLKISVHDVPGPMRPYVHPTRKNVLALIAFARRWPSTQPIIVHCHAGISRSTAAALIMIAEQHGVQALPEAAYWIADHRPEASPNRLLLALADPEFPGTRLLSQAGDRVRELTRDRTFASSF